MQDDECLRRIVENYARDLVDLTSEESLLWYAASKMVGALGFEDCVIYKLDHSSFKLVQIAAHGPKSKRIGEINNPIQITVGHGVTGYVAMTQHTMIVDDVRDEPRYISDLEEEHLSEITVPILIGDEVYGVIDCEGKALAAFSETHLYWLKLVAALIVPKLEYLILANEVSQCDIELIADKARLEQELQDNISGHKDFFQAQSMQKISQLSGGLAHDFNNQLAVMRSSLDLLVFQDKSLASELESTINAIDHCAELTQQMLAFSSQQTLFPDCVNLVQVIEGMKNFLQKSIGNWINIETKIDKNLWNVKIDQRQFESALLNLAVNARDAMQDGGLLSISCYNVDLDRDLLATDVKLESGEYVVLSVSDTGAGMSDYVREHATEPYFSTKKSDNGTGLGLSMVYGFVHQSGGELMIASALGEGTSIKMFFPRDKSNLVKAKRNAPIKSMVKGHEEVILVIEDDPHLNALLGKTLCALNYRPLNALTADMARELVIKHQNIDLVLSDVLLDQGNRGNELVQEFLEQGLDAPCIFMSGYVDKVDNFDNKHLLASKFLQKPFSVSELSSEIARILKEVNPNSNFGNGKKKLISA